MRRLIVVMVSVLVMSPCMTLGKTDIDYLNRDYPYMENFYKDLHANPELSGQEKETSKKVASELKKAGFVVTEGVGGYGVVGVLKNGGGPTIMLRADMDALPVKEESGLPFASKVKAVDPTNGQETDVMHACGHDMTTTGMIGTARMLAHLKKDWHGTLIMVGQPAEELGFGAKNMIKDGLFTRFPRPDYIIGFSEFPIPIGTVAYREGEWFAGYTDLDVTIRGIGGHGAVPQHTKDPIVIAAQIVQVLQTIVSREADPLQPTVVTVGAINGGSRWNIIPAEVQMRISMRSFSDKQLEKMVESVRRIASGVARSAGVPEDRAPEVNIHKSGKPLYCAPDLTGRITKTLAENFGKENIIRVDKIMGAEDFADYGLVEPKIPLAYYAIGYCDPKFSQEDIDAGKVPYPHNPHFAPTAETVEPIIKNAVKAMTAVALDLFAGK